MDFITKAIDTTITAFTPADPHASFPVVRSGERFYVMKSDERGGSGFRYLPTRRIKWSAFDVLHYYGAGHLNTDALVQPDLWPYIEHAFSNSAKPSFDPPRFRLRS